MPGARKTVSLNFDLETTEDIVGHTRYLPTREVSLKMAETASGFKYAYLEIRIRQYPRQVRASEAVSASDQNLHRVEGYRQKFSVGWQCELFWGFLH